jgi:hypothetical protein
MMDFLRKISFLYRHVSLDIKKHKDEEYILIYQMGKVGSSSIQFGLGKSIHAHSYYGLLTNPLKHRYNYSFLRRISHYAYKFLQRQAVNKRNQVKIITIYRDPLDRNISMFFQDLPYWLVEYDRVLIKKRMGYINKQDNFDYLLEAFIEVFPHDYVERWLNEEFRRMTGMNPSFLIRKSGWQVAKKGKFKVLSLAFYDMTQHEKEIQQFTSQDFSFSSKNRAEQKWYGLLVKDFKERACKDERVSSIYSE